MCTYKGASITNPKHMEEVQNLGLASVYRSDSSIKLFCSMIDALAFLPCEHITDEMDLLHSECPIEPVDLLVYFDTT